MKCPQVTWEHFISDLTPEESAKLFKVSVGVVAFSISSYCNRQCGYCPNSIADRKSNRNYMSDGLFFNILRQLCRIDYSAEINLTRYNEPLADRDYALSRIRDVRMFLPKAQIHLFSNGDYLDRDYLEALERAGVDSIAATVHSGPGGKTDIQSLMKEQDRRLLELGLPFEIERDSETTQYRIANLKLRRLSLAYAAHDFYRTTDTGDTWAFDRGGSLPIPKTFVRTSPCFTQFSEVSIEWDGTLLPCCQIQNDVFDHDKYVLGKLDADSDMFSAWTNVNYTRWRINMFSYKRKDAPCTTCNYGMTEDSPKIRAAVSQLRAKLAEVSAQSQAGV